MTAMIVCVILTPAIAVLNSSAAQQPTNTVNVSVPVGNYVAISAPMLSKFTVVSLSGGQGYQLKTIQQLSENILQFTPSNASDYSLVVNVSSAGQNYAYVTEQSSPVDIPACNSCNFTGTGNILVDLTVNATSVPAAVGVAWNPVFGLLPLRLQIFSLSFLNVIEIVAAFGFLFLALGITFRSRISYLGIAILFIAGAVTFGLLIPLAVIALYLVGFALVNITWRVISRRTRK